MRRAAQCQRGGRLRVRQRERRRDHAAQGVADNVDGIKLLLLDQLGDIVNELETAIG